MLLNTYRFALGLVLFFGVLDNAQAQVHQDVKGLIAGSQLVSYTRTSIFNDSQASSLTYVNFCTNGVFWVNYDGSFLVEGDYGGTAQGASNGQYYGNWEVVDYQGAPYLMMKYQAGNTEYYPIYKHLILQGRWRSGNTQYAIQRNKVVCN